MDARWTHARVRPAIEATMRLSLRVGTKGQGRELGAVQYWMQSDRSMDEADRICMRIEADARAHGYVVLQDADAVSAPENTGEQL